MAWCKILLASESRGTIELLLYSGMLLENASSLAFEKSTTPSLSESFFWGGGMS